MQKNVKPIRPVKVAQSLERVAEAQAETAKALRAVARWLRSGRR